MVIVTYIIGLYKLWYNTLFLFIFYFRVPCRCFPLMKIMYRNVCITLGVRTIHIAKTFAFN